MKLDIKPMRMQGIEFYVAVIEYEDKTYSTQRMSWDAAYQWLEVTANSLAKGNFPATKLK